MRWPHFTPAATDWQHTWLFMETSRFTLSTRPLLLLYKSFHCHPTNTGALYPTGGVFIIMLLQTTSRVAALLIKPSETLMLCLNKMSAPI